MEYFPKFVWISSLTGIFPMCNCPSFSNPIPSLSLGRQSKPFLLLLPLHLKRFNRHSTRETQGAQCVSATTSLVPMGRGQTTSKRNPKQAKPRTQNSNFASEADLQDIEDFSTEQVVTIRASLLEWYDENQRDLPWRLKKEHNRNEEKEADEGDKRAYDVWVSEVMLQQTRVQTVIDYYNRWMSKWPTLHHLAQASLEEVNEMWAGLGYYRRARFLLEGSKMIAEGGMFPRAATELRKVKGIGDYTAGAIASIAFQEAVPVVDGNVIRVIARLKASSANPKDKVLIKNTWRLAGQLVDPIRPGDFNQALMELGATICSPLNPNCSICPLSAQCRAFSLSENSETISVTDFPTKAVKTKQRLDFTAVCVLEIIGHDILEETQSDRGLILVKRPDEGLLAGLWEFPSVAVKEGACLSARRKAVDQFLKKSFNLIPGKTCSIVLREDIGECVHIFSHIRLKMHVEMVVLRLKDGADVLHKHSSKNRVIWKCVSSKAISSMGLTSGVRKAYTMAQKFKQIDSIVGENKKKDYSKKRKRL